MAGADAGGRDEILRRVRAAVKKTAPRREFAHPVAPDPSASPSLRPGSASGEATRVEQPREGGRVIFAPVENPLERFQAECKANLMEVVLSADKTDTSAALREVLASLPAGEVYVQDAPWLRELGGAGGGVRTTAGEDATHPIRWSSAGAPVEASQATVSLCEALVALTGSVLVSSSCGGRGISAVAPCHIVVARLEQLVPDLESALARARAIAWDNSYVGLITGSSRTADIEKLLVIGAHGPRRLVVIVQK